MGHRDDLLVIHNLSEGENYEPRPYPRGSVRRASGFVLTGNPEIIIPGKKSASGKLEVPVAACYFRRMPG